jgi:aspartate/methionine/tyrosine aminotransferase
MTGCQQLHRIKPFLVMEILEKAQQMEARGETVHHLEIGEPDFDTPECVKEAACKAMDAGHTHYTHSLGITPLREAVAAHYHDTYGVGISPDQVVVTSGTSPALLLAFSVLAKAGDDVILSDPGYPCYASFIEYIGARPNCVRVHEEDGFQYRVRAIRDQLTPDTRAVLVNSPGNPTGTLLSDERLQGIADLGPCVVSDEIYHGLVYEGRARSILEFTDKAMVLNGFSKLYAMTGWRLGYLIAPEPYLRDIQKLAQNFFICAGSVAQWAGVAALSCAGDDVARMRATYDERRRYLLDRLDAMGLGVAVEPTGAFYVLANVKKYTNDSLAFALDILEKAHVAVAPGIDFGPGGEGYLRFSYANSLANIKSGLDNLQAYLVNLR